MLTGFAYIGRFGSGHISGWRIVWHVFALAALLSVTACGGQPPAATRSLPVEIALTPALPASAEKASSANLLNLNQSWQTWAGDAVDLVYDPNAEQLLIPASGTGTDLVIAMHRFELPLIEGRQYNFSANGSHPDVAITPFLFDTNGAIIQFPGAGNLLPTAHTDADLSFVAPANVAGFYLQVQNYWQADRAASLSATLTGQTNGTASEDQLILASDPWQTWSGEPSTVGYDASLEQVVIPAPVNGIGNRLGVQRFKTSLTAGTSYELGAHQSSAAAGAVLLFLFDADNRIIPFTNPANGTNVSWLQATAGNPQPFTAPVGITGFAIQIQSDWNADTSTTLLPSLRQLPSPDD